MPPSLTRQEAERLVNTYADLILRLSYTYLSHTHDAQDICQTVFLKLIERRPVFASSDPHRGRPARPRPGGGAGQHPSLRDPASKYRAVIYLHYYEGYRPGDRPESGRRPLTVNTQLRRGREQLKTLLEKEGYP